MILWNATVTSMQTVNSTYTMTLDRCPACRCPNGVFTMQSWDSFCIKSELTSYEYYFWYFMACFHHQLNDKIIIIKINIIPQCLGIVTCTTILKESLCFQQSVNTQSKKNDIQFAFQQYIILEYNLFKSFTLPEKIQFVSIMRMDF